jgi:hypothetical protein
LSMQPISRRSSLVAKMQALMLPTQHSVHSAGGEVTVGEPQKVVGKWPISIDVRSLDIGKPKDE